MKKLGHVLEELRDTIKALEDKVGIQYPGFEDVLEELRLRGCDDQEVAIWLGSVDPKLGAVPLELIADGNTEEVFRRLRNDDTE